MFKNKCKYHAQKNRYFIISQCSLQVPKAFLYRTVKLNENLSGLLYPVPKNQYESTNWTNAHNHEIEKMSSDGLLNIICIKID